ncbi:MULTISPECIES: hypothetical protein [Neobacillus]|uniref:Uncharacterized protein n=1 Tax=Neobacillus rhizophilus TaxID=2833579 RepID=A0A942YW26_9BACI|nr:MULTISPECIES: hypothetical protein [Neobacillus]MBS4214664.1 hypothetical protein [Neobacillus rhizophilus]MBU8918566.1 hypothetical protein [Bacillus sp. FJAT-29953]
MKTVSVNELKFKKNLTMIEQFSIQDFLFRYIRQTAEEIDDILKLEYSENVFAKMEAKLEPVILINGDEQFRYVTITEDNQIVIGVLDSNKELKHSIIFLDEV